MSGGRASRHRATALVLAAVATGLVLVTLLSPRSAIHLDALDPENPLPQGAQAVARVLRSHGVQVTVVRRARLLESAALDRDTTLLVTSTDYLGASTARQVRRRAAAAGALVLAQPGPVVLKALRLPLARAGHRVGAATPARCDDPLMRGLTADLGGSFGYRTTAAASTTLPCFPVGAGTHPPAVVVRVAGATSTYALGSGAFLANHEVTRADNAAVALRLLGQHDRLVWYVADPRDVPVGDAGAAGGLLPRGLGASTLLVVAAVLATMLWRGRRLGPLAVEPLPVVVKAVESTQGRGRLYRRVRDRDHAAGILRRASSRRLAQHLRLPEEAGHHQVVEAVAAATGRSADDVHDLLVARPVPDDTALTRLARELAALEKESFHP